MLGRQEKDGLYLPQLFIKIIEVSEYYQVQP